MTAKLHLGCGLKRLPGFLHVDIRAQVKPDIVSGVEHLPFPDSSIEEIYFCHGLEHVMYKDVPDVLAEWKRVLIPGGILRLSVPNFPALIDLYRDYGLVMVRGALNGGQEYESNIHYSTWDEVTLRKALLTAGFVRVSKYNARKWLEVVFNNRSPRMFDWSVKPIRQHHISLNMVAESPG